MTTSPNIAAYFDEPTNTVSYLVSDPATKQAAIIDSVLDYDHRSGKTGVRSAAKILADATAQGLTVVWILETHAHADHLTAAPYLKTQTGAQIAIGAHIGAVQDVFSKVFNLTDISGNGAEFDRLMKDGETFALGDLTVE